MLNFEGGGRWGKAEDVGNLEIKQSHSISKVVEGRGRQRTLETLKLSSCTRFWRWGKGLETSKSSGRTQFQRWWKVRKGRGGWKPQN